MRRTRSLLIFLMFASGCGAPLSVHDAAKLGETSRVRTHLDQGGDVNSIDNQGFPLLTNAVRGICDVEMIRLLLLHGADVNGQDAIGWPPIYYAIIVGNKLDAAQLLFQYGADLNANIGHTSLTLLDIASDVKNNQAISFIKQHGGKSGQNLLETDP